MKEYTVSKKVYNEIINSKIARFELLGYKDSKGKFCDKDLIRFLPDYVIKDLTEEYEIDLDDLSKEENVIIKCVGYEAVYCHFSTSFIQYEKGYLRKINEIKSLNDLMNNKNLKNKDNIIIQENKSTETTQIDETRIKLETKHIKNDFDINCFFLINKDLDSKIGLLQLRLTHNIHKILEKIDLKTIRFIKGNQSELFKVKKVLIHKTIDGDIIIKIYYESQIKVIIDWKNYAGYQINTNLDEVVFKIMQNLMSDNYIDLDSIIDNNDKRNGDLLENDEKKEKTINNKTTLKDFNLLNIKKELSNSNTDQKYVDLNSFSDSNYLITNSLEISNDYVHFYLTKRGKRLLEDSRLITIKYLVYKDNVFKINKISFEKEKAKNTLRIKIGACFQVTKFSFVYDNHYFNVELNSTFHMKRNYLLFHKTSQIENDKDKKIKVNCFLPIRLPNDNIMNITQNHFMIFLINSSLLNYINKVNYIICLSDRQNNTHIYPILFKKVKHNLLYVKLSEPIKESVLLVNYSRIPSVKFIIKNNQFNVLEILNYDIDNLNSKIHDIVNKDYVKTKKTQAKSIIQKNVENKIVPQKIEKQIANNKSVISIQQKYSIKYLNNTLYIICHNESFFHLIQRDKNVNIDLNLVKPTVYIPHGLVNIDTVIQCNNYDELKGKSVIKGDYIHVALYYPTSHKNINIIKREYMYSHDYFSFFDDDNTVEYMQLIKSANNHATRHHNISEKEIQMVYHDKKKDMFNIVTINAFYCENCRKYFCFYQQFVEELKRYNIVLDDFLAEFYDEYHTNLSIQYGLLHVTSLLAKYGYSVSMQKGLSSSARFRILSFIIDRGIMTRAEIISHIQYLIRYNGKKKSNKYAVEKWKEDISYLSNTRNR